MRPCGWCRLLFSGPPDSLYCSDQCRYDAKKYRRNMRREAARNDGSLPGGTGGKSGEAGLPPGPDSRSTSLPAGTHPDGSIDG